MALGGGHEIGCLVVITRLHPGGGKSYVNVSPCFGVGRWDGGRTGGRAGGQAGGYVCMHVYIYIYTYIAMCLYTYIPTNIHVIKCVYIYTYIYYAGQLEVEVMRKATTRM